MSQGVPNTIDSIRERLIERPDTGCLIWPEYRDRFEYGTVGYKGRKRIVHHLLWEAEHGPVPDGMELDHTCEYNSCANLNHLEPVTPSVNCQRRHTQNGYTKGTQQGGRALENCKANHPEDCWYTRPNGKGYCNRRAWRTRKAA